ncbi:alcohol dehydrogenase catalytic domain-containing protein, partial [Pseudomonas syringae group genomosp. 3]
MKAFFINRYGKSSGELPEPKVGGNDVLVQIHAASINPLDLKIRTGEFKQILPYTFPLILGNDLAGVVVRAVLLSDALPTAHEIGVQYGNV